MKQSVLGQPPHLFKKNLDRRICLCVIATVFTLILHIILTSLRTQQNHNLLLWCNIGCSIICGFVLVYQIFQHILPSGRLYSLHNREKQTLECTVTAVSSVSVRYMDMDCLEVTAAERRLFLPAHTIRLQAGTSYRLSVVSNIIVEAEQ